MVFDPYDRTPAEIEQEHRFEAKRNVDTRKVTRGEIARMMRQNPRVAA